MAQNGQHVRGLLVRTCTALILLASPAFAGGQDQSSPSQPPGVVVPSNPDFMLGRPRASIGMRGNWLI